jgi:hypothetical protein
MSRNMSRLFLLVLLLGFAFTAWAQEAAIVGSITDPTGAVIPGATITITNAETGQATTVTSNEAGQYVAPSLRIGTYTVKAEASGFKTWMSSGLVLRVGDRARVDAKLEIGTAAESVTVEAGVIRVQSETSEISDVVTGSQITSMMSNGRHFGVLAALVPGASSLMQSFNFPQAGNVNISFNGANPAHNVWLADGAENYDRGGWGTNFMPSMDAVAEFRTLTSNYSAEYGLASGATMSMVFKSGTRDLHGSAWEYLRNDKLQANDWFRNKAGSDKPPMRFNVFGYNISGPVTIGSFNRDRDKTFFFFNQEWRKLRQFTTNTANVAPTEWYTGDLSSLLTRQGSGGPIQIYVPNANRLSAAQIARFAAAGLNPGDPFPNNQIPASLIDPNATAFLGTGAMPAPSYMDDGIGKWTGGSSAPNNVREDVVRIDHRFNDKFAVFGHYLDDALARVDAPVTWSGGSYPTVSAQFTNPSYSFVFHTTHTISPTVLNEIGFNIAGNSIGILPNGTYQKPSGWNVPELFAGNDANMLPRIAWQQELNTNWNTWNMPWTNMSRLWQIRDDLSWVRGRHELKFGGSFETYTKVQKIFATQAGNFTFNGNSSGSAFADFLLGYAASYQEAAIQDSGDWKSQSYAFYFQDNWRATDRLTINLGLRWEGLPAVFEVNDRMSNFYPDLYDPAQAPIFLAGGTLDTSGPGFATVSGVPLSSTPFYVNGLGVAGNGVPRGLVNNTWNNWAPRVGFAYDVTGQGKTVIRAGFGRMYERVQGNDVYNGGANPPFAFNPTVNNVLLSNPATESATGITASAPIYPTGITGKVRDNYKSPTSNQWSLSVQHELFPRGVLSVAYVGNFNLHQSSQRDINSPALSQTADRQAIVDGANINLYRPYLGWGSLTMAENAGVGNYRGLQTNLRVSAAKGLDLQIAYTYSRAYNQVRAQGSGGDLGNIDNPYDRAYNDGLAPWDATHVMSINYIYELPFFKNSSPGLKFALGGWQIAGIATFSSGNPLTLGYTNARLGMSGATNRPDFSGTPELRNGAISGGTPIWFTDAGFSAPADLMFGNAPKDLIRGPGRNNWDMSIFKNFPGILHREGSNLQFRLETFNTFNHTQWNVVGGTYGAGSFGQVTSTRGPRDVQLGLRLLF